MQSSTITNVAYKSISTTVLLPTSISDYNDTADNRNNTKGKNCVQIILLLFFINPCTRIRIRIFNF